MTWNCTEHTNFGNVLNSFIKMILFRPDAYTFTVSMPIYYESGGSLSGAISDVLSNIDPGSMPSADGASKKAKKASFDKEYSAASKTSDSEIETDLDRVFIYVASCMGAIGAVIVNAMFSAMLNYGERRRHSMREYSYYSQKLRFDHMAMIPVALIFSPLIVTATDFTHKLDRGMSIQIFDFFGAILAGFLVQMMIMKLAAQTTDKLLEKIMAREVRDDLP